MKKGFLISVSVFALVASAGVSAAQEKGAPSGSGQAPAAQQSPAGPQPSQQPAQEDLRGNRAQGAPNQDNQTQQEQRQQPGKNQAQDRQQPKQQTQDRQQPDQRQQTQDKASPQRKDSTTGQGAAGSSGSALTSEQRTKISTTIRQTNVRPVTNVNFRISVGTVVPRSVTLHPLPAAVIEVYPEWRPYRFVLVGDQILVIDPATHQIVAVLEA
jgi:hypothetical protein